ncbi:hypothetical protein LZZ85_12610 [Terrimonas sp. NA20]|uniref:Cupin n=1 Tax=Terrimonas ginsenosidimutans TaxID=2908004 RepID=A0ABS9KS58_9BACT|nr:hypothetical protein [Terrimonas ginsenosidimutans]MCG2615133.1 hypothetical protein [Terrimonas ginsenosidimutans]
MDTDNFDNNFEDDAFEGAATHITIEIIEYSAGSSITKTIIKKYNNSVSTMSFDSRESLRKRTRPHANFIQVVAGNVEIIIDDTPTMLDLGQGIVVPAHSPYYLKANSFFKMINTMVHDGSE